MKRTLRWIRLQLGVSTLKEICEASLGNADYHDYPVSKGGDGYPSHFYEYTCHECGKKFGI